MSQNKDRQPREQTPVAIPPFEVAEKPDLRSVFVSGVFGGLDPTDGRVLCYNSRLKPKNDDERPGGLKVGKIVHEPQVELHMSPSTFKSVAKWMADKVAQYEAVFGKIPEGPAGQGGDGDPTVPGYS